LSARSHDALFQDMDSTIRRFEREAVLACLIFSALALVWPEGGVRAAGAVLGGGALAALSYLALKGVVTMTISGTKRRIWPLVKFFTRYAILAFVAYVMLARLRLHPVGVIVGATSIVVAAGAAAIRTIASSSRSGNSR
jgi:hypothetical protein